MTSRLADKRGAFVLSLDFELMWGLKGSRAEAGYAANVLGARRAVPQLLELFREFGTGCTWATVGFLMFGCRDALMAALPRRRPRGRPGGSCSYSHLDAIGTDEASDPLHYGRSLVERIAACPRQEIATHTFSHYCCLDGGWDDDAFAQDIRAARAAAGGLGLETRSIVFPRNQLCARALDICCSEGIRAYRGSGPHWFNQPAARRDEGRLRRSARLAASYAPGWRSGAVEAGQAHGMVNVPASRFLRPCSGGLAAALQLSSIRQNMRHAARTGKIFHLWFHPHNFGRRTGENLALLRSILAEQARLQAQTGWPSLTMAEAAEQLA
jgi:hypothetical protein